MSALPIAFASMDAEIQKIRNVGGMALRNNYRKTAAVSDVCVSFSLIPQNEFTESAAQELIEALFRRIESCPWMHTDHGINAIESLQDAAVTLEQAAEDMANDAEAAWDRQQQRIDEGDFL